MQKLRWPIGRRGRETAPEIKDSRAGPLIALTSGGRARWTPRDYAHLAVEGFGKNAVAYRCVRMIAEAAASTPLVLFADGVRTEDHPLARLLARPNPEQSGAEWLEALYGALQTAGNAYAEAVGEAEPEELWTLRPDRVKVVPGRAGWAEAYDYSVDGRSVRIGRAADGWMPVMQLKLFHPTDDHYGFSPLEAAASAIDVHNASGAWNKALLDNAARPSGALVYAAKDGERLTAEQFEGLRAQVNESHAGTMNAGRPMILEGGLDWKPMSWTPADMDFIAGKHAAAREIALAFGVPPRVERGLPLIWRAGPTGGPPGGVAVSEVVHTATGVHDRPWSPSHLRAEARADGGFDLGWAPRSRIDGDRWEGEPATADPLRFRVRILAEAMVLRTFEAEGVAALYPAADAAIDFPAGPGPGATVAVAQWGDGYGWGLEARAALG